MGILVMQEAQQYRRLGKLDAALSDAQETLESLAKALQGLTSQGLSRIDGPSLSYLLDRLDAVRIGKLIEQRQMAKRQLCETRRKLIRLGVRVAS